MSTLAIRRKPAALDEQGNLEKKAKFSKLSERLTEELVIAVVGPVGSGCTTAYELLEEIFKNDYAYDVNYYKLSDYIIESAELVREKNNDNLNGAERIIQMQPIGDKLRKIFGKHYLAAKAVEKIAELRETKGFGKTKDNQKVPKTLRHVHIIDSIKHPEELKLLRATYGDIFWLIGIFAPMSIREQRLKFQQSFNKQKIGNIVQRDYMDDNEHGQKVRDVFYQADFFIRNDQQNKKHFEQALERFFRNFIWQSWTYPNTGRVLNVCSVCGSCKISMSFTASGSCDCESARRAYWVRSQ